MPAAATMRAVIDSRSALDPRATGIGRYAKAIVEHIPAADPDASYVAWHLDPKGVRGGLFPAAPNLIVVAGRFPNRWYEPVSSRLGLPKIDRAVGAYDVLLAPNFLPPATSGTRSVPVVHDLAFDVVPGSAPHIDARWRRRFVTHLLSAPRVIVPSSSTRDDLLRLYEVDPARVDVVHHGTAATFVPAPDVVVEDVRRRYDISPAPFALFVGGIEPRKNLEVLVAAFAETATGVADVQLVIAGGGVAWFPQAEASLDSAIQRLPAGARSRVIRTGYVSDDDRAALMTGATFLAYPSSYEGFGFPVLEAFAAGLPVLTSNVSSLPEVAGEAASLVDPSDRGWIATAMETLFSEEATRKRLIDAGRERVGVFSWDACAAATADVLHRACA
jgi:glycosyltransferase involved in cell wall biosynthesis